MQSIMRSTKGILTVPALFLTLVCLAQTPSARMKQDRILVQDSLEVRIYFPVNRTAYYPDFRGNEERIQKFLEKHDSLVLDNGCEIQHIAIVGAASAEGRPGQNDSLSQGRSAQIIQRLRKHISLADARIDIENRGADWDMLAKMVKASDVPSKERILEIIGNTNPHISRIWSLRALDEGQVYKYLLKNILPEQRFSKVMLLYKRPPTAEEIPLIDAPVIIEDTVTTKETIFVDRVDTLTIRDTVFVDRVDTLIIREGCNNYVFGIKTNLLYDAGLVPNLGVEFPFGKMSAGINWQYAWWTDAAKFWWKTYGGDIHLRFWPWEDKEGRPLSGHHFGIYGQICSFDWCVGDHGIISYPLFPKDSTYPQNYEPSFGGGIEYGYSLRIGKVLNLDFSIGLGYLTMGYMNYTPTWDDVDKSYHYVYNSTHSSGWIGPTKLEISLVWLVGYHPRKKEAIK